MKVLFYLEEGLHLRAPDEYPGLLVCDEVTQMLALTSAGIEVDAFFERDLTSAGLNVRRFSLEPTDLRGLWGGEIPFAPARPLDDEPDAICLKVDRPSDAGLAYIEQNFEGRGIPVINGLRLRECHRKDYIEPFSHFMPATLYSSDVDECVRFWREHQGAIIKPIHLGSGRGIERLPSGHPEEVVRATLRAKTDQGTKPIVVQEFLEAIFEGHKRVMIFVHPGGPVRTVAPARLRPPPGAYLSNFCMGGIPTLLPGVSEREQEVAEAMSQKLLADQMYITGADFIGDKLIELNTINPGFLFTWETVTESGFDKAVVETVSALASSSRP